MSYKKVRWIIPACALAFGSSSVHANLTGPDYPVAGVSWSGNGDFGVGSGASWTFTVDEIAFSQLYWGFSTLEAAMDGAANGPAEQLTGQSHNTTQAVWTGTTEVYDAQTSEFVDVFTRFTVSLAGNAEFVDAVTVPEASQADYVLAQATNDFSAVLLLEASLDNQSWQPFYQLYDSVHTSGEQTVTSFSGGLWHEAAVVPAPASSMLVMIGLGLLQYTKRRLA